MGSAPPSTDHQDQAPPPPPPPTQQQTPPPPPSSPGHPHQQTSPPSPPSAPGHQQTPPPPPQRNQFCSNCSGSRGRQDDCRQYFENISRHHQQMQTLLRRVHQVHVQCWLHHHDDLPPPRHPQHHHLRHPPHDDLLRLGLHLPPLLAVNVLHCFLINMNPFFLTLFSILAFHRTVVQKRPLFNMNNWRRNFSTHCHRH